MVNTENQIFDRIKSGDIKAYESIFKQFYEALCHHAFTFLKDQSEAEEAVQKVFVTIWNKKEQLSIDVSIKSYLYRAVSNTCLNRIKQTKNRNKHHSEIQYSSSHLTDSTTEMVSAGELEKQIMHSIHQLPEQCRVIFELSRFEGLRYHEIAEQLGISVKTVENQIGKALKTLRETLKDFLPVFLITILTLM